jgi:hypothetical protein
MEKEFQNEEESKANWLMMNPLYQFSGVQPFFDWATFVVIIVQAGNFFGSKDNGRQKKTLRLNILFRKLIC